MTILLYIGVSFLGYVIGSISFALIIGKKVGGVDVREVGSGNLGGTNVLRVLGAKWGITVMILDILKGVFAAFVGYTISGSMYGGLLAGIFSILGHLYPLFAGFKGGKGVATGAGVFMYLIPYYMIIVMSVFFLVLIIFRYVSLGSIVSAASGIIMLMLPEGMFFLDTIWPVRVLGIGIGIYIILKHKNNIIRLKNGEEKKIF